MSTSDRETLLAQAYAIEHEAAERYRELAEQMYGSNNDEVGDLFTKMAEIEGKHAAELSLEHGAADINLAAAEYGWESLDSPEAIAFGDMHYLLPPQQALTLALAAERRALAFYENAAAHTTNEALRALAVEFAAEEATHVRIVLAWLARLGEPEPDWDEDMDPPISL